MRGCPAPRLRGLHDRAQTGHVHVPGVTAYPDGACGVVLAGAGRPLGRPGKPPTDGSTVTASPTTPKHQAESRTDRRFGAPGELASLTTCGDQNVSYGHLACAAPVDGMPWPWRPFGPGKPVTVLRADIEAQVVYRGRGPVVLDEAACLDHRDLQWLCLWICRPRCELGIRGGTRRARVFGVWLATARRGSCAWLWMRGLGCRAGGRGAPVVTSVGRAGAGGLVDLCAFPPRWRRSPAAAR
jgi:hypothetical protein